MRIIDFHTHIYPDIVAQKATESICRFYELKGGGMNGTVKMLLEQGGKVGIEKYVVLPVGLKPERVRHINDFIVDQVAQHEEFVGFGTVHAGMEHLLEETEYIRKVGLRGIKMHPDTQLFPIDDERLLPMYDLIQGKLPVLFHMGDTRYDYSHPARLRRVLKMFPKLEVIAAHLGGYSMYETGYEYLHDTDCVMDISSSLMFMSKELAEKYIRLYGADRLVFGSDFPLWNPEREVKRFLSLDLTEEEQEKIAYQTALRVLKNKI